MMWILCDWLPQELGLSVFWIYHIFKFIDEVLILRAGSTSNQTVSADVKQMTSCQEKVSTQHVTYGIKST